MGIGCDCSRCCEARVGIFFTVHSAASKSHLTMVSVARRGDCAFSSRRHLILIGRCWRIDVCGSFVPIVSVELEGGVSSSFLMMITFLTLSTILLLSIGD